VGGQKDALGAARGHAAGDGGIAAEEAGNHCDVGLHAVQAREHAQPESVLGHEERVGFACDSLDLLVGVPDEGGVATTASVEVVTLEVGHLAGELVPGPTAFGNPSRHLKAPSLLARDDRPVSEAGASAA
jgi:hypothetical protein